MGTLPRSRWPLPRSAERFGPIIRFFQGIMLVVYWVGCGIWLTCTIINFFIVLFTGKWNLEHRQFIIDFNRWYSNVFAWILCVTNTKPPLEMR